MRGGDFVEGGEGEGLREHGRGEGVAGQQREQDRAKAELREEGEAGEGEGGAVCDVIVSGGFEIEEGVVRGEVVAVVQACEVVDEGVG